MAGRKHRHLTIMELYVIEDYKEWFPALTGQELTDALVLQLLVEHGLLEENQKRTIIRLPGGKPVLSGGSLHFSVSHTGSVFACAAWDQNLGLDIQKKDGRDRSRLAGRYFTRAECRFLEENGPDSFYRLWTRKEAYAKYTGQGLAAVISGSPVLDRQDVEFLDLVLDEDLYGCICIGK